MTLYNARLTPDPATLTVTKFDALGNPEASYLTSEEACTCPAGMRPVCRHRTMLPNLRPIADTHWFYDYDRHDVVDLNGMTKATFDRMEANKGYYGFASKAEYEAHYSDPAKYADEIPMMEQYTREAEEEREAQATQLHPHPEPATPVMQAAANAEATVATWSPSKQAYAERITQPAPTRMRR